MPLIAIIGCSVASHDVSAIEIAVWRNKSLAEIRERFDEIRPPGSLAVKCVLDRSRAIQGCEEGGEMGGGSP